MNCAGAAQGGRPVPSALAVRPPGAAGALPVGLPGWVQGREKTVAIERRGETFKRPPGQLRGKGAHNSL